tara:strand:+ start:364 stop:774 length:411 start_codon:yes stop_codon:yes gene_type:complete
MTVLGDRAKVRRIFKEKNAPGASSPMMTKSAGSPSPARDPVGASSQPTFGASSSGSSGLAVSASVARGKSPSKLRPVARATASAPVLDKKPSEGEEQRNGEGEKKPGAVCKPVVPLRLSFHVFSIRNHDYLQHIYS